MTAPPTAWTAGTLASDLCQTLGARGWITVREIALDDRLTHRGDVVAMLVSGRRNRVDVYELKVARSDLLGDLRREKWRAYLRHGAVWFAFPAGLADPREIPIEAGVIVRRADGWLADCTDIDGVTGALGAVGAALLNLDAALTK